MLSASTLTARGWPLRTTMAPRRGSRLMVRSLWRAACRSKKARPRTWSWTSRTMITSTQRQAERVTSMRRRRTMRSRAEGGGARSVLPSVVRSPTISSALRPARPTSPALPAPWPPGPPASGCAPARSPPPAPPAAIATRGRGWRSSPRAGGSRGWPSRKLCGSLPAARWRDIRSCAASLGFLECGQAGRDGLPTSVITRMSSQARSRLARGSFADDLQSCLCARR